MTGSEEERVRLLEAVAEAAKQAVAADFGEYNPLWWFSLRDALSALAADKKEGKP